MGKNALRMMAAALLLCSFYSVVSVHGNIASAQAKAQDTSAPTANQLPDAGSANVVPNRITGFTAWDDEFLYVALQVTKPALTGLSKEPFTDPMGDDAVVVSIQTDNDHKAALRTAHTVSIAISEAGGTQIYSGEKATPMFNGLKELQDRLADIEKNEKDPTVQQSRRVALLSSIPKIQVSQVGAPRPGAANYPGYTVELAIPWTDLGGKPEVGARMGFNAVALSKSGGSPKVQSLAAGVHGIGDVDNPSLWSAILFGSTAKNSAANEIVSPRVFASKPVIDGQLSENEWNRLAGFEFGERGVPGAVRASLAATIAARTRPEFTPQPPRPVVANSIETKAPGALKPHATYRTEHLVFAKYEYSYQGDPRKEAPAQMVFNADHSSALAHHPLDGAGPWFSFDHADWHRAQLTELRRAGVDVILPIYRADSTHRKSYADKGLLVLTSALEHLKRNGFDYPQVGLSLDSASIVEMMGDRVDLRDPAIQSALYAVIRDFYLRIPPAFRCCIQLDPTEGARTAYPVFLGDVSAFKDWDGTFTTYARLRFRSDPAFKGSGADLVFVGPSAYGAKAGLDSYIDDAQGNAQTVGGWIKTVGVGAGFDVDVARIFSADASALPPRHDGATYRTEWTAALAKHPDWVLLQNWNDYTLGGEIAPSLEAGFSGSDLTRIFTHMFNGSEKFHPKFVWNNAPAEAAVKSKITVQVRVQNAGVESWGSGSPTQLPVNILYRWRKNGQVVATDNETVPVGTVSSGGEVTVPVKVLTALKGGTLTEGDYTLEIGAALGRQATWNSETSVQIPVTLRAGGTAQGGVVTVVDSDLPRMLETGSVYQVTARLRNDGDVTWRKSDGFRAAARIYRVADGAPGLTETPVVAADSSVSLPADVAPGEETDVHLALALVDPAGQPLPAQTQESGFTYAIRWEVSGEHAGAIPAAVREGELPQVSGSASALSPIGIGEFDFGVRFTQDGTLSTLPGERRQPVTLGLKNVGPQTWKRDSVRIGYHWYYQDGSEFLWEDETTALPQDVPPGGTVNGMLAWVTPPPCDGNYYLVWDVKFGDTWASTSSATRVFDQAVHPVQVTGGRLVFADLNKAYNLDGVSDLATPKDGDFDGKGHTFPAALIPPFTDDGVVPAGIWQPYDKTGPESPRHISFKWGSKEPKSNNFIVCRGQRVDLGKYTGKCRVVHIIAASVNANVTTSLKLVFQEPSGESEDLYSLSVSRWDQPPVNGEETVFTSKRHHDGSGSEDGTVSLYHYTFVIRDPRKIAALKLPLEPNIRIAAVTLER